MINHDKRFEAILKFLTLIFRGRFCEATRLIDREIEVAWSRIDLGKSLRYENWC